MKRMKIGLAVVGLAIAAGALAFGAMSFRGSAQAAPGDHGRRGEYEQILAQKLGISVQQLQAAETAARNQMIDNAVAAGKLTPDQATQMKNHQGFGFGFRGPDGNNGPNGGRHHKGGNGNNGAPPSTPPGPTRTQ